MGGHPQHVCSRVGGRGRHRALRCHGVAVRARRRVRAVPDLQQRTLALRTAPRSHRSRLPSHVRRPYARSKDAAVTSTLGMRAGVNAAAGLDRLGAPSSPADAHTPSEGGNDRQHGRATRRASHGARSVRPTARRSRAGPRRRDRARRRARHRQDPPTRRARGARDRRDQLVLTGSASELERDLPFSVFVDALDEYAEGLDPRRLGDLDGQARAELAHVFPSLVSLDDGVGRRSRTSATARTAPCASCWSCSRRRSRSF